MTEKPANGLSRRERQIMEIIYALESATAVEVLQSMPDPPSKTAVRTFLRILEEKGHLKHTERGREYVYQPIQPRIRRGAALFAACCRRFLMGRSKKQWLPISPILRRR